MAEMWNGVADAWERNAAFVDAHMAAATEVLLDAAGIGPGAAVLDIACGPGGAGLAAAQRVGGAGRVVLADAAPAMVQAAARRVAALPHASARPSDELAIDAPDGAFDAVICRHGLMFAEPPAAAVREVVRVLRPGGRYAAMTWAARADNAWLGQILDAVAEQLGMPFPPPGIAGPFALEDPDLLATVLSDGGLHDVRVQRVATPMHADSLEAWWDLVPQLAGPLAIVLSGMDDATRDAIRDRALGKGQAVARISGDGVEFDGAVLVGSGHRA